MKSFTRVTVLIAAVVGIGLALSTTAWANLLTNGDFENTTGWGAIGSTSPPASWYCDSGYTNPAGQQSAGDAIGGSGTSAFMQATNSTSIKRNMNQDSSTATGPNWVWEFDFASEDPPDGKRSLNFGLNGTNTALVGWVVTDLDADGDGDIQYYSGGWTSLLTDCVIFDDDVQTTPLVHHLKMVGHWDLATPTYDLFVTDSNGVTKSVLGSTLFDGAPTTGEGLASVGFQTRNVYGDYLIDNVSIIPEPGTLTLLGVGALGLVFVAWRKRRSR